MILKWLSGLFSGGESDDYAGKLTEPTSYEGFLIYPQPRKEGGQWLTAGLISKEVDGELKEHSFIRADKHMSREDAVSFSLTKARQIIDQQGNSIFKNQ